ncbi:hypothetical protein OAO18_05905 [Francisellaceae bacterium]|nr:hypothetical protein [Francisellaceae bacterium]
MKKASKAIATLFMALPIIIIIIFCLTLIFSSAAPNKKSTQDNSHQVHSLKQKNNQSI